MPAQQRLPPDPTTHLTHTLVLPTLLFAALGGMTWAVRGCSGFGAVAGCIFAGVTWGIAWWYLAHDPRQTQSRRYASAWVVPALTFGIGFAGARGWMQWPSFFEGKLLTDAAAGKFVPIPRAYGFLWLFIAGIPWAGLGACALAWTGSLRDTRAWHWALRIGCGVGAAALARYLFNRYPQHFLPLYDSLEAQYRDRRANPNLLRLTNDCGAALYHLGFYLGFLAYELLRRDWKNALLILTVGLVNGAGWALFQNWKWANALWGPGTFNFWRCWESSGGISIGIAYGLAYFLVNRPMSEHERDRLAARHAIDGPTFDWLFVYAGVVSFAAWLLRGQASIWGNAYLAVVTLFGIAYTLLNRSTADAKIDAEVASDPNLERWGMSIGLLFGLGFSIRNGLKGWFNIYRGNEAYWSAVLWRYLGPTYLVLLILLALWILLAPLPRRFREDVFPHAYALVWTAIIAQNVIAQLVTGPHSSWPETAFAIYYVLLFAITAVILIHFRRTKRLQANQGEGLRKRGR